MTLPAVRLNKGYYMSAHVLLNLLTELRRRDQMQSLAKYFIVFLQQV